MIIKNLSLSTAYQKPDPKFVSIESDGSVTVYDGSDIPSSNRNISPYTFRQRFTDAEMASILALAYAGDVSVRKLLLKLQTTDFIDLDNTEVINGCQYLVSQNAITEERKTIILS